MRTLRRTRGNRRHANADLSCALHSMTENNEENETIEMSPLSIILVIVGGLFIIWSLMRGHKKVEVLVGE